MTEPKDPKVARKRRRLYEPLAENSLPPEAITSQESSQTLFAPAKTARANDIIEHYMMWAAGTALIPVPGVDMAAFIGVELTMLKKLCEHYDMEFSKHRTKSIVIALLGSLHVKLFTGSVLKFIPGFGLSGAILTMGVFAVAVTHALGKVFVLHFETGGTLLDFDPAAMKTYFIKQYKEGQNVTSTKFSR